MAINTKRTPKCDMRQCNKCIRYDVSCDGYKNYIAGAYAHYQGDFYRVCDNIRLSHDNTPNSIQLAGFSSLYREKVKNGLSSMDAFVEAIVQTSDTVFASADHSAIEKYKNRGRVKQSNSSFCPV